MKDLGHDGLNKLLAAYEDKSAKAVCTFGFSQGPGHEPILFQGITDVSLGDTMRGWSRLLQQTRAISLCFFSPFPMFPDLLR